MDSITIHINTSDIENNPYRDSLTYVVLGDELPTITRLLDLLNITYTIES